MDKITNKIHLKPLCLIIIMLCLLLVTPVFVSAFEFDNRKEVLNEKGLAGYNDIIVGNFFGLGATLWEGTLKTNTDECGSECSATQTIILYKKGSLIDDVIFEKVNGKERDEIEIDYKVYIKVGDEVNEIDDYETNCDEKYNALNKTYYNENCIYSKVGSHFEDEIIWEEYILGTELEIGTYEVKLEGNKNPLITVDWIYRTQGETLDAWAFWSGGSQITDYWSLDTPTDSNYSNAYNSNNTLRNGTLYSDGAGTMGIINWNESGVIGGSLDFNGSYKGRIDIPDINMVEQANFTFQTWLRLNQSYAYANSYVWHEGKTGDDYPYIGLILFQTAGKYIQLNMRNDAHASFGMHSGINLEDGNWHQLVIVKMDKNYTMYVNGTLVNSSIIDHGAITTDRFTLAMPVGATDENANRYIGWMDEVGKWDRAMNGTEVIELYNNGLGVAWNYTETWGWTTSLISPVDYFNTSLNEVEFNCSSTLNNFGNITNMTLWHNATGTWESNVTNAMGGIDNSTIFNVSFSDGSYLWGCEVWNNNSEFRFSDTNRTFTIDTTSPSITVNLPTSTIDFGSNLGNETLNWTVEDINLDSMWYDYNGTNITVYGALNESIFQLDETDFNLTFYTNDSFGNTNSNFIEWVYNIFVNTESYNNPIPEGSEQPFFINVTNAQASLTPFLIYDGESYIGSFTQTGSEFYCSRTLDIPTIDADINKTFYWSFLMPDVSVINSSSHNLTVTNFAMDNCTVNEVAIMNLSLKFEENNTLFEDPNSNIQIEVDIYSLDNILIGEYNHTWINESEVSICIGNLTGVEYNLYSTIGFSVPDYVNEFWFIDKKRINTTIIPIAINLMDLASADSTSFLFNYFDEDGLSVTNPIIHTWRKYIGEGLFREVERSKQNNDGNTIVHLVEEDVIYYFQVSQNDTVIFTSDTYTALCDTAPCTITLEASGGYQDFSSDWDLVDNGAYTVSSSAVTRTVNLTFDTTTPSTFNLTVYKLDSTGEYEYVGSDETTGTSGTIEVIVPHESGNVSFFSAVEQDDVYKASYWADFTGNSRDFFGSGLAIFLGILIIMTLGLMAISEGSGTIVFVILGMFLTVVLGLVDYGAGGVGIGLMIYFIVTGGIIIWKLTRRNR